MTTKIQTALRLALEAKRFRDLADIEVHRTRRGHWHPPAVPCTRRCPMGDPRTALVFDRQLQRPPGSPSPPRSTGPAPSPELSSQPCNTQSRLPAARLLLAAEQTGRAKLLRTPVGRLR